MRWLIAPQSAFCRLPKTTADGYSARQALASSSRAVLSNGSWESHHYRARSAITSAMPTFQCYKTHPSDAQHQNHQEVIALRHPERRTRQARPVGQE
jgi:hypothetical protein